MDGQASFWWNINCYWYNNNVKKSFSRIGLILPTPATGAWMMDQDIYGLGLTNSFNVDRYCAISSLRDTSNGVIAFPVRHTRDYDSQSETGYKDLDYNPLGDPGLYPANFKTIYFDTKETATAKAIVKLMSAISIKISDTNLEPDNTNYKMKFVPATVTSETFEPDTYYYYDENFNQEFVKTDVVKPSGYYPAYEFNSEDTYYKQVYDVDDTKLSGTKYVQVEIDELTFEPGKYYTYFDKEADEQNEVNFIINTKNYVENTPYYEVAYIDKTSNKPVYQKVTLTETEFYSGLQNHNYYRLVTFTAQPEEYTVTRIQLDSDKSIYRDVLGSNLVEITDDNVIVGGENLIPNLTINKDKITAITLENNAETIFEKPIENLIIEIPNSLKHGFCSFVSFETAKTDISVSFNTVYANKPLKFIFSGATVKEEDLDFATETQYNIMFLCNGIYLEVYIQEIQLLG